VYATASKKWLAAGSLWCRVNDEDVPKAATASSNPEHEACKEWVVQACTEGEEPTAFWKALGGKKPYATASAPPAAAAGAGASGASEPRLFHCSTQTGAFRVEEVDDFSQEDLEHDDVYILDLYSTTYVWVGRENENQREIDLALETADQFVQQQAKLDQRRTEKPILVRADSEPHEFTKEFVGWSATHSQAWEDPYEKKLRLQREAREREVEEMADTADADAHEGEGGAHDDAATTPQRGAKADARWEGGLSAPVTPASIPVKNIVRLTSERNGGKPPPVSALLNGNIILRNARQVAIPGAKPPPAVPALQLGKIPKIHEASSLDSARRRANAAVKAAAGEAGAEEFANPETERFHLDEIQKGSTPRLNPVCKELYLIDSEFTSTFGMEKDLFWKQPFWKQRDAKRKAGLF
jgi:hypothetical protein